MINENVYFIDEGKNYNDLVARSLEFSAYLKQNKIKQIAIFLESSFDFCVALFGAMSTNVLTNIVAKHENSSVNDENFGDFRAKNSEKFSINLDYHFNLFTSGSSGTSKCVKKSIKSMFDEALFLRDFLNLNGQKFYTSVSHQHMFGLSFKIFLPLVCGGAILSKKLEYTEIIKEYDFSGVIFVTSPIILNIFSQTKLDTLNATKLIITAGSKLDERLRDNFRAKIFEIYGSTETGVVAGNFGGGFEIFKPVKISLNENSQMMINSAWCDNFLSSDMAKINGDKLTLLGRFDRIVKLNEFRFNLSEAENTLKAHKFVRDAACALLKNDNRISALIVLSDEGKIAFRNSGKKGVTDSLKDFLFAKFKTNIRHFKFTPKLPFNSFGKLSVSDFEACFNAKISPEFSLKNHAENIWEFGGFLSEDCHFFASHFRNFPLTPGFMELDFVFLMLEKLNIKIPQNYRLENLKFTAFLRVFDEAKIWLKTSQNRVDFKIFAGEKLVSSGKIIYE